MIVGKFISVLSELKPSSPLPSPSVFSVTSVASNCLRQNLARAITPTMNDEMMNRKTVTGNEDDRSIACRP